MTMLFSSKFRYPIVFAPFFWAVTFGYDYGIACDQNNSCVISNMTATAGTSPDLPSNVILNRITKLLFVNTRIASIPVDLIAGMIKLQQLNASNSGLEFIGPSHFGIKQSYALQCLTHLWLKQNLIGRLEDRIFAGAKNLQTLDLSDNSITNVAEEALFRLQALVELDLSHNKITTLREKTFLNLKLLKKLNLAGNLLSTIPEKLFQTTKRLTSLDMSWNRDITIPPMTLPQSLTSLVIHGSGLALKSLKGGLLRNLKDLETLDLSSNGLKSNISMAWFSDQIRLNSLNIAGNGIQEMLYYDKIARILPRLRSIDISKNSWDCQYLKILLQELRRSKITVLKKDDNIKKTTNEDGVTCNNPSKINKVYKTVKNGWNGIKGWFKSATTKARSATTSRTSTNTATTPSTPKPIKIYTTEEIPTTSTTPTTTVTITTTTRKEISSTSKLKSITRKDITTSIPRLTKTSSTRAVTTTTPIITTEETLPTPEPTRMETSRLKLINSIPNSAAITKEETLATKPVQSSTTNSTPKSTTSEMSSTIISTTERIEISTSTVRDTFTFMQIFATQKEETQKTTSMTALARPFTSSTVTTFTPILTTPEETLTSSSSPIPSSMMSTSTETILSAKELPLIYYEFVSPLVVPSEPWNFQSHNLKLLTLCIIGLTLILTLASMLALVVTIVVFRKSTLKLEENPNLPMSNEHLFNFNVTVC